jgi:hypothetical protein
LRRKKPLLGGYPASTAPDHSLVRRGNSFPNSGRDAQSPLWKPLCYAQIGGLAVATFITLLLVPVFYSIFVLDLKWIKWETTEDRQRTHEAEPTTT